jgi:hypothetical protein
MSTGTEGLRRIFQQRNYAEGGDFILTGQNFSGDPGLRKLFIIILNNFFIWN